MPDTIVTIRVEETAKKRFDKFCEDVGINMSAALNMFIYTVIREQRIPFEISSSDRNDRNKSFKNLMESIEKIQKQSVENGLSEMTMDEIDAEIALARKERKERELLNV